MKDGDIVTVDLGYTIKIGILIDTGSPNWWTCIMPNGIRLDVHKNNIRRVE